MTFSIAGFCPETGMLGTTVSSSSICVNGSTAEEALAKVIKETPNVEWRQLGMIDQQGNTSCFSGQETLGIHNMAQGKNCVAMGNLLDNDQIPKTIITAFENSQGHLADRLLAALQAGLDAGGEAGSVHSAGVKVYSKHNWPVVDLRVDWDPKPDNAIPQLISIWKEYQPQMEAYITRATNPDESESYGVPGDE